MPLRLSLDVETGVVDVECQGLRERIDRVPHAIDSIVGGDEHHAAATRST